MATNKVETLGKKSHLTHLMLIQLQNYQNHFTYHIVICHEKKFVDSTTSYHLMM